MTTKVTITCQENSHWDLKVTTQDKIHINGAEEWSDTSSIVLGPGEIAENIYVYDTRRYLVEEKVRD